MTRSNNQVRFRPLLFGCGPKTNRVYRRVPDSRLHKSGPNTATIQSMGQIPAAHVCRYPANGSRSPTPTKTVFVEVPRVLRFQRVVHSRRASSSQSGEPPSGVADPTRRPRRRAARRILPSLDSTISSSLNSDFPGTVRVELHSGRMSASGHSPTFGVCRF